jgi:hypothetical protein
MAFEAQLAADRKNRIPAGQQLPANKNVHPSAAARKALLAGEVDPWPSEPRSARGVTGDSGL